VGSVVHANYFDGRSTRVRAVGMSMAGEDLIVSGEDVALRIPFSSVTVDERLGRAARRVRFSDGSFCEVHDLIGLDTLLAATAHRDGWVDRVQRRARFVLLSVIAFLLIALTAYHWGLPWAAAQAARRLPTAVGKTLSAHALKLLEDGILTPSHVTLERQRTINSKFQSLRLVEGGSVDSSLLFRASSQLGANAFTLPDGTIIVTDELVAAIGDDRQIIAVFSHELGHAHGRHGLQLLLQSSAIGAFLTFYLGDISTLLAAAPAAIVQARYSRKLEQQADDYGAALLAHNGMSPALLADALEKLAASHPESPLAGYLASHPATDARMRHLRILAGSFKAP
jgi:Zn-dependent protease with chaperone function